MLKLEREIHVVDGDVRRDFEDDWREIENALNATGNEAIHHGLREFHRHAEDRELDGMDGDEFFLMGIEINVDLHPTDAGGGGIRIEGGNHLEAFFFKSMVTQKGRAETPGADQDDRLEVLATESLPDDGGENFHRVAEAAGAELAEVGEVFAELCGLHPGGPGKGGGADGLDVVHVELLQTTMIDRKAVNRFFRNI